MVNLVVYLNIEKVYEILKEDISNHHNVNTRPTYSEHPNHICWVIPPYTIEIGLKKYGNGSSTMITPNISEDCNFRISDIEKILFNPPKEATTSAADHHPDDRL